MINIPTGYISSYAYLSKTTSSCLFVKDKKSHKNEANHSFTYFFQENRMWLIKIENLYWMYLSWNRDEYVNPPQYYDSHHKKSSTKMLYADNFSLYLQLKTWPSFIPLFIYLLWERWVTHSFTSYVNRHLSTLTHKLHFNTRF